MTPPVVELSSTEVFDAYEKADGPIQISAPGRQRILTVIDTTPAEEHLSEEDLEELRLGYEDFERGDYMNAEEFVAQVRQRYGLYH